MIASGLSKTMKKTYPTVKKARSWAKHLKPEGKRRANKGTRKVMKPDHLIHLLNQLSEAMDRLP